MLFHMTIDGLKRSNVVKVDDEHNRNRFKICDLISKSNLRCGGIAAAVAFFLWADGILHGIKGRRHSFLELRDGVGGYGEEGNLLCNTLGNLALVCQVHSHWAVLALVLFEGPVIMVFYTV